MNFYFGAKIKIKSNSDDIDSIHLILFQADLIFSSEIAKININEYLKQASEYVDPIEEKEFCRKFIEILESNKKVYFLKSHPEEVSSSVLEAIGLSFYQALMTKIEDAAIKK